MMNLFRHNGVYNLSEMRRLYDEVHPSSLEEAPSLTPVAPMYGTGGPKRVDFKKYMKNYGNRGRYMDIEAMEQLQDSLIARKMGQPQRLAVLATAAQEMGQEGAASRGIGGNGYLGLSSQRMPEVYLDNTPAGRGKQIHYILNDLNTTHSDNWLDGGAGGPKIMSGKDGFKQFWNAKTTGDATRILNKSYIRPAKRKAAWDNRAQVAEDMEKELYGVGGNLFAEGGPDVPPQVEGLQMFWTPPTSQEPEVSVPLAPPDMQYPEPPQPVNIPGRNQTNWFRQRVNEYKDLDKPDPSKMNRRQVREFQENIANEGGYAQMLEGMSKDQIKEVQRTLINKGFLSSVKRQDGSYKEEDGIVGRKTLAAWNKYNIDGIWGKRSQQALQNISKPEDGQPSGNWNNNFSTTGIDQCATWVTRKYESVLGPISRQNGVYGNAWQMPINVVNAGGQMLFNLYDHGFEDVHTPAQLKQRTKERLKQDSFDYTQLQPGDVVGIYYPYSEHHQDVLNEGTTYNTHVGIVTGFDSSGVPIIEHNMGGSHKKDKANALKWGSSIVTVSRPKVSQAPVQEYDFKMGKSGYSVDFSDHPAQKHTTPEKQQNLQTFMNAMAGATGLASYVYPDANMDAVQRIAISVLGRETAFMQDTESTRSWFNRATQGMQDWAREHVLEKSPETKSSDLTKFKMSSLSPDERELLGIHSPSDLENPAVAGRASLFLLAKNYDYFKRLAAQNPGLGLTEEDIKDLTSLSYNQGMGALYHIGARRTSDGSFVQAPDEIEKIRSLARNEGVIDDMGATKLGQISDLFPALAPVMKGIYENGLTFPVAGGNAIHINIGTRNTSYMQAARRNRKRIKKD